MPVVSPHLPSSMFLQSILAILLLSRTANGCGSGVGGNNDYEILQDPVFSMEVSPPVGWTYFPVPTAQPALFFVGQSNDTGTAKMRADTEIVAAMTQAMVEAQLPVYNVQITNNYQPDDITNAGALTTGVAGAAYGQLAGGAITGIYEGAGMIVYIPYMKKLDVTIRNAQTTRYTWNLVKNNFLQKMALNYNAKFTGDITVNRF